MRISEPQLRAVWRSVLELSRVGPGQNVLVLTSQNSNPSHIDMALGAAGSLGATAARLRGPAAIRVSERRQRSDHDRWPFSDRQHPMAISAMKAADLVIDLIFLLFTPAQRRAGFGDADPARLRAWKCLPGSCPRWTIADASWPQKPPMGAARRFTSRQAGNRPGRAHR